MPGTDFKICDFDTGALIAWCRQNMATYKVPAIHIVDALPMTATGKVKKEELARLLA